MNQETPTDKHPLDTTAERTKYRRGMEPAFGPDAIQFVSKDGEEGIITIDKSTGNILTHLDEMPEWTNGLLMAITGERIGYYNGRLGDVPPVNAHLEDQSVNFADLAWLARDDAGNEADIPADAEYRNAKLNDMLTSLGVLDIAGNVQGSVREIRLSQLDNTQSGPMSAEEAGVTTAEHAGMDFLDQVAAEKAKLQGTNS
jgi:hypothetical protein